MSHLTHYLASREPATDLAHLVSDHDLAVIHRIIGWLLLALAALIIVTANRGRRMLALAFAAVIVLVVVADWGPASGADAGAAGRAAALTWSVISTAMS